MPNLSFSRKVLFSMRSSALNYQTLSSGQQGETTRTGEDGWTRPPSCPLFRQIRTASAGRWPRQRSTFRGACCFCASRLPVSACSRGSSRDMLSATTWPLHSLPDTYSHQCPGRSHCSLQSLKHAHNFHSPSGDQALNLFPERSRLWLSSSLFSHSLDAQVPVLAHPRDFMTCDKLLRL